LTSEGLNAERIESLFAALARTPWSPDKLVLGARDALGDLLDEIAFDTGVDLEQARSKLTAAWPKLGPTQRRPIQRRQAPSAQDRNSDEPNPVQALRVFDAGRAAGHDLESLFDSLEQELELEPGERPDPDELAPAPDFPGVVDAMLSEFRWEIEQSEGKAAAERHNALAPLGEYASRLGRFEELDRTELLRFTTFWLPERGRIDGSQTRDMLDSLLAFCTWAQAAHELPLSEFAPTLTRLRESLPRIIELNRVLPPAPDGETGELYEVQADARGRFAGVRDRAGQEHRACPEPGLAERLRPGDRLRGSISLEGRLSVFRCYPPEAGGLTA
jgi:hypothetical protein